MANFSSTNTHSKKLGAGTILVPKKERQHYFKENARYVVTKKDIAGNATIGDYWEILR